MLDLSPLLTMRRRYCSTRCWAATVCLLAAWRTAEKDRHWTTARPGRWLGWFREAGQWMEGVCRGK